MTLKLRILRYSRRLFTRICDLNLKKCYSVWKVISNVDLSGWLWFFLIFSDFFWFLLQIRLPSTVWTRREQKTVTLNNTLLLFPIQGPKDGAAWQTTLFLNFMEVEQGKRQGYIYYILRLLIILHQIDGYFQSVFSLKREKF